MKYISFSLWGTDQLYCIGALENAKLVNNIYKDWKMVVYYDNSVPENIINSLNELNVLTINANNKNMYEPFWRFLASDINDCEYAVFRDCDSRISVREKLAVDEWIRSGKILHVMRDHPAHRVPFGATGLGILAGMWGIKGNVISMENLIRLFSMTHENIYGVDQTFLSTIYQMFINNRCTHDPFFEKFMFPIKRENGRFIGERINPDNTPYNNDYLLVI